MRRYLSWIEGLTTNQNVTGSNPVRRTTRNDKSRQSHGLAALLVSRKTTVACSWPNRSNPHLPVAMTEY